MRCPRCSTVIPDSAGFCSHCGRTISLSDQETLEVSDAAALSPGTDFGPRYRVLSLLGQGAMGRVYKAHDKELDRDVAIKVIRPGMISQAQALMRFKQELLLASKVSHKHVLRIHDMGDVGDVKFISMAYVEGRDLHEILLETSRLPLERALNFARQLAEALAAAHAEGVVHRDLKPQNIMVDKDDQIYVSDFGLARSFEDDTAGMTRTGAFLGTPKYMSPEQAEGKLADRRSDLYSYGLILYEMVTGTLPFAGGSSLQVMYQRLREKPKSARLLNPEIPAWFDRVIMRCLEKDVTPRYQCAGDILADLGGGARYSGSVRRAARPVQIRIPEFARRRWIWAVAGISALAVLSFAVPSLRHMLGGDRAVHPPSRLSGVPPPESGRFVAVLPLQVLGDESQFGYLAYGIEEALSAKLFHLKDIRIIATDAAGKIDQKQPLSKIAGALGANLVVQGTLQGSGNRIRIILNLQDVADGTRLWSQEFDGLTGDMFTLEDEIYNSLVSALHLNPTNDELAKTEARPTENIAAYDYYLRGRNALRGDTKESIRSALNFFDQSLQYDRTFALAYTGIADASLDMYAFEKDSFWIQKGLAAAQQAQRLNDQLPEVHSVLGAIYTATGKYAEAIAELNRALSLAPNSDYAYRGLGRAYLSAGNGPKAIEMYQKAIELNPYFWVGHNSLGNAYFQLGDYQRALQAFQQVTVLEPDMSVGYENVGNVYLQEGEFEKCIPYFQKALQIQAFGSTYSNLGIAYFYLKQYPNSAAMFEKAVALEPNDTTIAVNLADAYRASGQQDRARAAYERAISLGYKELSTNPRDARVMAELALAYAKTDNAQQAMSFIHRVRTLDKSNVQYIYVEAVIEALLGRSTEALKSLREAFEQHYPVEFADADPDLENLHHLSEYAALVQQYSAKKP